MYILGDMAIVNSDTFQYFTLIERDNREFLACKVPENDNIILIKRYFLSRDGENDLRRIFTAFENGAKSIDLMSDDEEIEETEGE